MTKVTMAQRSAEAKARRRRRRKSHVGKAEYPTREYAEGVAYAILTTRGEVVEAYDCEFGQHWHVGHHPRRSPMS